MPGAHLGPHVQQASLLIALRCLLRHARDDLDELLFGALNPLAQLDVVALDFLGCSEQALHLLKLVPGNDFVRFPRQLPDPSLVLSDSPVKSFQALIDTDELTVTGYQIRRGLLSC